MALPGLPEALPLRPFLNERRLGASCLPGDAGTARERSCAFAGREAKPCSFRRSAWPDAPRQPDTGLPSGLKQKKSACHGAGLPVQGVLTSGWWNW